MTIISFKHRFIFMKPYKVAGTSLMLALSRYCDEGDFVAPAKQVSEYYPHKAGWKDVVIDGRHLSLGFRSHTRARELRPVLGDAVFNRFLKISAIRNPFDQAVSAYVWLSRGQRLDSLRREVLSFRAWLLLAGTQEGFGNSVRHFCSIDQPYDAVDVFVRFEHFEEDLTLLSARLGFQDNIYDTFKHIHMRGGPRRWTGLTSRVCFEGFDEGIKKIRQLFDIELERFGYDLPWLSGGTLSGTRSQGVSGVGEVHA